MNEMQTYNSTEVVSAKSVNTEMMISRQAQEVQAAMVVAKRFPVTRSKRTTAFSTPASARALPSARSMNTRAAART